jgi:tRNA threonylcarbamoyladenosine biosynthesis protein TsaB
VELLTQLIPERQIFMRTLAIETTDFNGSVALLEDNKVVAEGCLAANQRSAQWLAPLIENVLNSSGWNMQSLQLLAIAQGPGSFTGLRVGITLAKTLAFALKIPVIGVDTLEVLAEQARHLVDANARIHAVMDAQRQELFVATFTSTNFNTSLLQRLGANQILSKADWLESLRAGDVAIGPMMEKWHSALPPDVVIAPLAMQRPLARIVGSLALEAYRQGDAGDMWKLLPHYFRPSYAEEKQGGGK